MVKKIVFFLAINSLFFSCSTKESDEPEPRILNYSVPLYLGVSLMIVDLDNNDRLNPESPGFWGEEYIEGIEMLYLIDGAKSAEYTGKAESLGSGNFYDPEFTKEFKPVWSYGYFDYLINCLSTAFVVEDDEKITYVYVRYPDGSEDEIKVLVHDSKMVGAFPKVSKVWFNGELAFVGGSYDEEWVLTLDYFNPEFYPSWFTGTYIDYNGDVHTIFPKDRLVIVITK